MGTRGAATMRAGERVELDLSYEDLDALMTALDAASLWHPNASFAEVAGWRRMERRFGEVLNTDLDDTRPVEPDTDEYRPARKGDTPGAIIPGEADAPSAIDLHGRLALIDTAPNDMYGEL